MYLSFGHQTLVAEKNTRVGRFPHAKIAMNSLGGNPT
jgi:hypothetical protein